MMKARIGERAGVLIPYEEFLVRLNVPQHFLVYNILDQGRHVELQFLPNDAFRWEDRNLLVVREMPVMSFIRTKRLFQEALGVPFAYFDATIYANIRGRNASSGVWWRSLGIPHSTEMILNRDSLHIWIEEETEHWRATEIVLLDDGTTATPNAD